MTDMLTTIIVTMLGSEALTGLVVALVNRKENKHKEIETIAEQVDLNRDTLAAVSYMLLADKLEHRIEKGYATKAHRREIKILYETYEKNGWNGDMDDMMEKFYDLPLEKPLGNIMAKLP